MQGFQVRENGFEQIITVCYRRIKCLTKNGIKRKVKHTLVRRVIYKQFNSIICTWGTYGKNGLGFNGE
jgi:hypothetical protein